MAFHSLACYHLLWINLFSYYHMNNDQQSSTWTNQNSIAIFPLHAYAWIHKTTKSQTLLGFVCFGFVIEAIQTSPWVHTTSVNCISWITFQTQVLTSALRRERKQVWEPFKPWCLSGLSSLITFFCHRNSINVLDLWLGLKGMKFVT